MEYAVISEKFISKDITGIIEYNIYDKFGLVMMFLSCVRYILSICGHFHARSRFKILIHSVDTYLSIYNLFL